MKYFIWVYFANILHRMRWLGTSIGRLSLFVIMLGYILLAQPAKPIYFDVIHHYINLGWLIFILSFLFAFIPSEGFILSMLAMHRRDRFMRNSLVAKVLRLMTSFIKYDILGLKYSKNIYLRLVSPKRVRLLCWAMYFYDAYKGFKFILGFVTELIVLFFAFVFATWLYVHFTHANLYYYSIVTTSVEWFWAIVSFLIIKVLFVPSFSALRRMIGRVIVAVIKSKFGINKFEDRIDVKLAKYEQEGDV